MPPAEVEERVGTAGHSFGEAVQLHQRAFDNLHKRGGRQAAEPHRTRANHRDDAHAGFDACARKRGADHAGCARYDYSLHFECSVNGINIVRSNSSRGRNGAISSSGRETICPSGVCREETLGSTACSVPTKTSQSSGLGSERISCKREPRSWQLWMAQ
ncbi:hypothetical protein SDC9_197482 [bioreactor metagenome]|uniref:Uncharacterized protein n=1 Tax=bioreactor metagenome TaxID=1076179 RepID=A0A645IEX8_9ZZZZ